MIFNFVDKLTDFESKKFARGKKIITDTQTAYMNNGLLYPMMLIEAVGQLNAWITMEMNDFQVRPVAILYDEINIYDTVKLNDAIIIETELKRFDEVSSVFDGKVTLNNKLLIEVKDAAGSFLNINEFSTQEENVDLFKKIKLEGLNDTRVDKDQIMDDVFCYDEVTLLNEKIITGKKSIKNNYPFFKEHFSKKPVLPISILLQNNINLGRILIEDFIEIKKISKIQLSKIKMRDFIQPNSLLNTQIELIDKHADYISYKIDNKVEDKTVCRGFINYFIS